MNVCNEIRNVCNEIRNVCNEMCYAKKKKNLKEHASYKKGKITNPEGIDCDSL